MKRRHLIPILLVVCVLAPLLTGCGNNETVINVNEGQYKYNLNFLPAVESAWREDLMTHVDFDG